MAKRHVTKKELEKAGKASRERTAKRLAAEVFEDAKVTTKTKRGKAPPLKGMPVHFVPRNGDPPSRYWGKADVPICSNYGPKYIGEALAWGSANFIEGVTCEGCKKRHYALNHQCRSCGTMITDASIEKYNAKCTKCFHSPGVAKVGMHDVQEDGETVRSYGAAAGHEVEAEAQLRESALAKAERKRYNVVQTEGIQPPATEEEVNMAKTKVVKPITTEKEALTAAKQTVKVAAKASEDKSGMKIKLLVKENPKRAGSKAFAVFACYKDGITVADFLKASEKSGGSMANVNWDVDHEFISLR